MDRLRNLLALISLIFLISFQVFADSPGKALWVWKSSEQFESTAKESFLKFLVDKNINTVFLAVKRGYFTDPDELKSLIRALHQKNIKVHALFGDADAIFPDKHGKVTEILKLVLEYNRLASPEEKFDGFQTDVEPHEVPVWRKNQESRDELNKSFIELHRECRSMIKNSGDKSFILGAAITGAREQENLYSMTININNQELPVPGLLAKELDYLAVMAYKKNAASIAKSAEPALETAQAAGIKCWVGLEINHLQSDLEKTIAELNEAFKMNPEFSGIAIHSYRTYRQ